MVKCRDCALYDLDAVKNKAGAIMSSRIAKCLWISKEQRPVSMWFYNRTDLQKSGYMKPNVDHNCPCFQKME